MKKLFLLSIFALILVGCGTTSTPVIVTSQVTQIVTQPVIITSQVTRQVTQIVTVEVTRQIIVTATYSGPTPTSTPTPKPSPTIDKTKADKTDGSYMVGKEIAPGIWRSSGGTPDKPCALEISTFSGKLEDITYQLPGATIRIPSGEFIVYIGGGSGNKCIWSFLQP